MSTLHALALDGELGIVDAAAQRLRLLEALQLDGDLQLDLGEIQACDSAGVQLLLALRRSLAERGHALVLTGASTPVRQALATYGLGALLPLPPAGEPA